MPTRYAMQFAHRQYHNNTRKKGMLDVELIMESEAVPIAKADIRSPVGSPVSVADVTLFPELKPLTLPDSWTVVGRNGKPVKGKMYDEPQKAKKKKKKQRTGKTALEPEPLADLEEQPSSSKCRLMSDRAHGQHSKAVTRARDAKYWAGYRDAKAVDKQAHATLKTMFAIAEHMHGRAGRDEGRLARRLDKMEEELVTAAQETMANQHKARRKSAKGDSMKAKTRRAARAMAAAERGGAFWLGGNEYDEVLLNPTAEQLAKKKAPPTPPPRKSKQQRRAPSTTAKDKSPGKGKDKRKDKRKSVEGKPSLAGELAGDGPFTKAAKKACHLM